MADWTKDAREFEARTCSLGTPQTGARGLGYHTCLSHPLAKAAYAFAFTLVWVLVGSLMFWWLEGGYVDKYQHGTHDMDAMLATLRSISANTTHNLTEEQREHLEHSASFMARHRQLHTEWGIEGGFMFSVLSLTTIGYGRFLVPRSIAGRLFVIPYTLVGIPLVAVMYTVWAKLGLNWLKRRVKDITGLPAKKWQTTAIAFCAFFIILFVIGPAIFSLSENWLYYESVYFVWCTLSTIGYGDFVPTHHVGLVVGMILIPVGLGVVALVFAAISQYYEDLFIYLDYDEDVYTKQVVHRTPELRPEYGALDNDEELDLTDKAGDPLLAVREAAPLLAPPPGSEVDEGIIEGQPVAS